MFWTVVLSTFFFANICSAQEKTFTLKLDKCEIASYDKEYVKDWEMDCQMINETIFQVSGKGEILKEINMDEVSATGQIYNFDGSKYVPQPQLKLTLPICDEYKAQTFGYWQEIEKHGNIKGCGVHKPGQYEVKDFIPKLKIGNFPIAAREGKHKLNILAHLKKVKMAELNFYISIISI